MIGKEEVKKILRLREQLLEYRKPFEPLWRDIARYINPLLAGWESSGPGTFESRTSWMKELFDETALKASNLLADGIQGYAFGRSAAWFRLMVERAPRTEEGVRWLQAVERALYSQIAKSNFYDEARTFLKIGADFGTAALRRIENPTTGAPTFRVLHLKHCYIAENAYGEVDTLLRDVWMSPDEAVQWFGRSTPDAVEKAYRNGASEQFLFVEAIFPEGRHGIEVPKASRKGKPFYAVMIYPDTGEAVMEGGYDVKPFYVWRWARSQDGNPWGVDSPGLIEIPNVKQLNVIRKDYLRMRQLAARPPVKATEGLVGRIRLEPSGITYLRAGEDFTPAQVVQAIGEIASEIEQIRRDIHEAYHTDFFLILTQNIERAKTATEVMGIQSEKAAILSAFFGRLGWEFLEPLVEDLFSSELAAGRLPSPPETLSRASLRVDMISPLAIAQKQYLGMRNTQDVVARAIELAQIDPATIDNIDMDRFLRLYAEVSHADARVLRKKSEIDKIRTARAEERLRAAQQQFATEQSRAQALLYKHLSKAPEPGSPAENMVGGA